jgi:hypothetical protein
MAKALNTSHRTILISLAEKLVRQTQEADALDVAYNACADVVSSVTVKKFPPKDMAILARYNMARPDSCVYISTGGSNYERFSFRADDARIPMRPTGGCNSHSPHLLSEDQEKIWDAYVVASKADKAAVAQRLGDFKTLISAARTFEELVALWPAAEELRERICGTFRALAVMSDEVLSRIKADPAAVLEGAN